MGTLGLGLVLVLPAVDEFIAVCNEKSKLTEQLATAESAAGQVDGFEKRMAEQSKVVDEARNQTLYEAHLADYRNSIVKLVRETGCQLRKLQINNPQSRVWAHQDNPLEPLDKDANPTGFQLEKRVVSLSLVGNSGNVKRLIEQFEKQKKQVHIHGIELRPNAGDGRGVEVSMELWYFTLARGAAA